MANVRRIVLEPVRPVATAQVKRLKVAAYCRVSTDTEDQKTSFDGQVKTYTALIQSNPEWELAGIYADEGITGTSVEKRPQFMQMIRDCEEGKINLILTKGISRFARNTLECLTYVRHLNNLGVHLVFEKEGIDTRTPFSEMLLTILAAFAQEESRSVSENTKWGIRKRFEEGETRWNPLYGYEKNKKGDHQIVPAEAAVVQKIFWLYEHGSTLNDIRVYLREHGIKSPSGTDNWSVTSLAATLANERYVGDILLQKYLTEDHLTHKPAKNDCTEVPSYYIENHHAPIVSRKQYERVKKLRTMRRQLNGKPDRIMGACDQYPLGEKLRCPCCGSILYKRSLPVQAERSSGWCCERGENPCGDFIIRNRYVEPAMLDAYEKLDVKAVEGRLSNPKFREAAEMTLSMKEQHPFFDKVDYWWVDDLVDRIEFGMHNMNETRVRRMKAMGQKVEDDRVMKVFWRCGIVTTVPTGIREDISDPHLIADLYRKRNERRAAKNRKEAEAV